jgi:hypothetical protein
MQETQPDEAAPGTVTLGDWVRVRNVGDEPVKVQWDSRFYKIPVDGETFMPFEAAKLWFGDPRSSGNVASHRDVTGMVSWIPDRATEVRRLRALYDNQFGDERVIAKHPLVEVYTQQGDRVYTVLDDPDGERTSPAVQSVMDHASLLEQVRRQQATIDLLVRQTGIGGPATVEDNAPVDDVVVEDEPPLTTSLPDDPSYDRTPRADDAGA